jgi:hypothetical protein
MMAIGGVYKIMETGKKKRTVDTPGASSSSGHPQSSQKNEERTSRVENICKDEKLQEHLDGVHAAVFSFCFCLYARTKTRLQHVQNGSQGGHGYGRGSKVLQGGAARG